MKPKRSQIKPRRPKSKQLPLLMTAVAGILLAAVAMTMTSVMGRGDTPFEGFAGQFAPAPSPEFPQPALADADPDQAQARPKTRCDECGEIKSMRQVAAAGNLPPMYEITVRMRDGSIRVNHDPTPADWRPGDRIKLIGGTNPAGK